MGNYADALFPQCRQKLLRLFWAQPSQWFYTQQIIQAIAMGNGVVQAELKSLHAANLLCCKWEGRQKYYAANPDHPAFRALCDLSAHLFDLKSVLSTALQSLLPLPVLALVYGSVARGVAHAHSDIDLLLVSDGLSYAEVMQALQPIESKIGRRVDVTLYRVDEFRQRWQEKSAFIQAVWSHPRWYLIGADDDVIGA